MAVITVNRAGSTSSCDWSAPRTNGAERMMGRRTRRKVRIKPVRGLRPHSSKAQSARGLPFAAESRHSESGPNAGDRQQRADRRGPSSQIADMELLGPRTPFIGASSTNGRPTLANVGQSWRTRACGSCRPPKFAPNSGNAFDRDDSKLAAPAELSIGGTRAGQTGDILHGVLLHVSLIILKIDSSGFLGSKRFVVTSGGRPKRAERSEPTADCI